MSYKWGLSLKRKVTILLHRILLMTYTIPFERSVFGTIDYGFGKPISQRGWAEKGDRARRSIDLRPSYARTKDSRRRRVGPNRNGRPPWMLWSNYPGPSVKALRFSRTFSELNETEIGWNQTLFQYYFKKLKLLQLYFNFVAILFHFSWNQVTSN